MVSRTDANGAWIAANRLVVNSRVEKKVEAFNRTRLPIQPSMITPKTHALLWGYLVCAIVVYDFTVKASLEGHSPYIYWADSMFFIDAYNAGDESGFAAVAGSSFGPVAFITLLGNNGLLIALANCGLFAWANYRVLTVYSLDQKTWFLFSFLNPILLFSLTSINKEILGVAGVLFFACYISKRSLSDLMLAILFSGLSRWPQVAAILCYTCFEFLCGTSRKWQLTVLVSCAIVVSLTYPYLITHPTFETYLLWREESELTQMGKFGGMYNYLNSIQEQYGYILVMLPKIAINYFGNVFRIFDTLAGAGDFNYFDLHNTDLILAHQYCMLLICACVCFRKKVGYPLTPRLFYVCIYSMIVVVAIYVNYRLFFPVYMLLNLELSLRPATSQVRP